jgi:hypothetical protein
MRIQHYLTSAAAIALIAGFAASSAKADVFVTAYIDKDKDVFVFEELTKYKDVFFDVDVIVLPDRAAEALALANQRLEHNQTFFSNGHEATIKESVQDNVGVTSVNQAAGFLNQQGNLIAAAVDGNGGTAQSSASTAVGVGSFAEAQSSASQYLQFNFLDFDGENTASIDASVTGNAGVTSVNQSAGDMNQQLNASSLGISFASPGDDAVALAEADLGQFLNNNIVNYYGGGETASITASVNNNAGITGVNQAAGAFNQQANVVAVSATAPATATLLTP